MSDLKNCPFCGSGEIEVVEEATYTNIGCLDCDYAIKCRDCDEDDAVYYWNTRPAENAKDKEIERLKKQVADREDEGYAGFVIGVEQMKKRLAEKDREVERLEEALKKCRTLAIHINPSGIDKLKVIYEWMKKIERVADEALGQDTNVPTNAPDNNIGKMEENK